MPIGLFRHFATPHVIAITLALLFSAMIGQAAETAGGNYTNDLGLVYGAILAVKFTKDICTESHARYVDRNNRAYLKWRTQYKVFIRDIDSRFEAWTRHLAKQNSLPHDHVRMQIEELFQKNKSTMRQLLRSPKARARTCRTYPEYLQSDQANLEAIYAVQVNAIHRIAAPTQQKPGRRSSQHNELARNGNATANPSESAGNMRK